MGSVIHFPIPAACQNRILNPPSKRCSRCISPRSASGRKAIPANPLSSLSRLDFVRNKNIGFSRRLFCQRCYTSVLIAASFPSHAEIGMWSLTGSHFLRTPRVAVAQHVCERKCATQHSGQKQQPSFDCLFRRGKKCCKIIITRYGFMIGFVTGGSSMPIESNVSLWLKKGSY